MAQKVLADGSVVVGCLDDVITPGDVKTEAKAEEITSPDVKAAKQKTTRKSVKK